MAASMGSLLAILIASSAQSTDFGIRLAPGAGAAEAPSAASPAAADKSPIVNLSSVASIGAQWGRVTSLRRSPARNRAVGGAPNSYHLSGRAVDIARKPGVRHAQIEAAFRKAGYHLVESLDEGDHSHFAFGSANRPSLKQIKQVTESTAWKVVYAPSLSR